MSIFEHPDLPLGASPDIEYYLEPIILRVRGTLFRIPKEYLAQESTIFLDLFQLTQPADQENGLEGTLDSNPVTLPDTIDLFSFRALTKLLYSNGAPTSILNKDEWIALLEIARMWDMDNIQNILVQHLGPLLKDDPAQKWSLAKTYEVHEWVRPALETLIRCNKPLGEREFQMLDQETMLKIAAIRESVYPVFRDTQYYHGYGHDTTITHWEMRQERGAIQIDLSSVDFNCPSPHLSELSEDQDQGEAGELKKEPEFYFEQVVFKVDDRLYRVPNQPFAQYSPVFRRRFEKRGFVKYDRHDPCIIEPGVSATDFTNLLRFFFPPKLAGERELTQEEWASILRLSSRWDMQELKDLAVQKLNQRDFGNVRVKLQVAQELGITEWFSSGMTALVTRSEPLTALECQVLSQEHILQVLDLRERIHSRPHYRIGQVIHLRSERGEFPNEYSLDDRLIGL